MAPIAFIIIPNAVATTKNVATDTAEIATTLCIVPDKLANQLTKLVIELATASIAGPSASTNSLELASIADSIILSAPAQPSSIESAAFFEAPSDLIRDCVNLSIFSGPAETSAIIPETASVPNIVANAAPF